jgi:hypothetical protein
MQVSPHALPVSQIFVQVLEGLLQDERSPDRATARTAMLDFFTTTSTGGMPGGNASEPYQK